MDSHALEHLLNQKFGNLPNERDFAYSLFHGLALLFISRYMRNTTLWVNEQYVVERASFGITDGNAHVCFTRLNLVVRVSYAVNGDCSAYDLARGSDESTIVTWSFVRHMMSNILLCESQSGDN